MLRFDKHPRTRQHFLWHASHPMLGFFTLKKENYDMTWQFSWNWSKNREGKAVHFQCCFNSCIYVLKKGRFNSAWVSYQALRDFIAAPIYRPARNTWCHKKMSVHFQKTTFQSDRSLFCLVLDPCAHKPKGKPIHEKICNDFFGFQMPPPLFEKSRGWGGSSSQFPNVLMRNCTSTTHTIIIHIKASYSSPKYAILSF